MIWTDVVQGVVMVGGFLALAIKGAADVGGYQKVWELCQENGRIDFRRFDLIFVQMFVSGFVVQ